MDLGCLVGCYYQSLGLPPAVTALLLLLWAVVGGLWYRFRGGGFKPFDLPRAIDLGVWALLMTLPIWFIGIPWWGIPIPVVVVALVTALGHGDFLDGGSGTRGDPDEIFAPLTDLITGTRDGRWHDTVGMAISGMSYTIVPAFHAALFDGPMWLLWLPIGALKGLAYAIGWRIQGRIPIPQFDHPTAVGEFGTGFLLCGGVGLLWVFVVG